MNSRFCALLAAAAAFAAALAPLAGAEAAARPKSEQTALEKQKVEGERANLEKRLSDMQKKLSEQEAQNEEANAALKKADQAISNANKRLRSLKAERSGVEKRLSQLADEGRSVTQSLSGAEALVDQIARAQYVNSRQRSWQFIVDGANPNEQSRMAAQLRYLALAQSRAVASLEGEQARIQSVSEETKARQAELKRIAAEEEQSRRTLLNEKRDRQNAVSKLKKEIATQQAAIDKLKKDQARLGNLVAMIDKRLAAERKAEEAEAKRQQAAAKRRAAKQSAKPIPLMKGGNFAKLKGKLSRPVSGRIAASFGSKRTGSAKWQGLLFRAPEGAEVSACAAGTVVFSDWLRGYGNLIIIDHGSTYMSVYANNETVLKNVGDRVKQGETISTVGASGGDDEPGLYFEIRYKGKPINPAPWLRK